MHDFTALAAQVWRAVSPIAALSPGQRPGGTMLHWLKCRALLEQPALWGATPRGALRALMGYALSARGIFAPAQKCRMYQSRSTSPQGVALGYGQHWGLQPAPIIYRAFVQIGSFSTDVFLIFSLRFSAALGNMSKLYCTRLHENSAALGIARTSSALHSLARKLAAARHSPSELGLCSRLAQTFLFSSLTNISYRGRIELKTFCIFAALFLILQCCLLIELVYALR